MEEKFSAIDAVLANKSENLLENCEACICQAKSVPIFN